MLTGRGRLVVQGPPERPTKVLVYLPMEIVRDSQYPFKGPCDVDVVVDAKKRQIIVSEAAR